uniref:Plasmodium variant antigen protein Cir/Yir/Bir n=1 Tax=Strongyloides venezuelensis TaxID=75913 RepID=A0A0K0G5N5_STRVS
MNVELLNTFLQYRWCNNIIILLWGKVLFEYSKSNDMKITINVYSCDGKEDIQNNLEDEACGKYYDKCGDCI